MIKCLFFLNNTYPVILDVEVKEKPAIPVLVTLQAISNAGVVTPAVRELHVGCISSVPPSKKVR